MKKLLFLGVIFGGLALTSCKKDYTCECVYEMNNETITHSFEIKDVKKKEAKDNCEFKVPGVDVTCDLKGII